MAAIQSSLLATKLYLPAQPSRCVPRHLLLQRLQEGLSLGQRLTLISAPAGYGKTQLVVEWVRKQGLPAAWISLDGGDNDFVRFTHYLIASLNKLFPQVGAACLHQLENAQLPSVEGMLTPLINELADLPQERPFLLILDDFHLIQAQAIHDAIVFLVEYLPPSGFLVLTTRADPPLPLPRWRGRGQLNELRLADLRFDAAETEAYLEMTLHMHLTAAELEVLVSRSEGWIAGLQMAAASLSKQKDITAFMRALSGSQRNILDYLLEEVLRQLPGETQDFLIHTSFLDRLCGPLCDAVLELPGSSQAMLESFERENLFTIPMDAQRGWYHYHHLFADLLQTRLYQQADAARIASLHLRACLWFEAHGLFPEAIELALREEDYQHAAAWIEQSANAMLRQGELITFRRWIECLPVDSFREHPYLYVYQAWALLWSGSSIEQISACLRPLNNVHLPGSELESTRLLPMRASLSLFQGNLTSAEQEAHSALKQLPAQDTFLRSMAILVIAAVAQLKNQDDRGQQFHDQAIQEGLSSGNLLLSISMLSSLANLLQKEGKLGQAEKKYQQALELASDRNGHLLPIAARPLAGLASIALDRNQVSGVEAQLQQAVRLSLAGGVTAAVNAYLMLARTQLYMDRLKPAQESLDHARRLARQFDLTDMDDRSVDIFQQQLNLKQNDLQAVRAWAEERNLWGIDPQGGLLASDFTTAHVRKYEYPILARLYHAKGQSEQALQVLAALIPHAQATRRPGLILEAQLISSRVLQSLGRLLEAHQALEAALVLAEPEGYIRLFVDEGPDIQRLIIDLIPHLTDSKLVRFAEHLLYEFPSTAEDAQANSRLVEPLSDRELEILRLLAATTLSAGEIAERLYISVSTVRTHIKSIYSKLEVHGRMEAVQRARELMLV